ncbi:MAG: hypothetical protein EXS38_02350 [Opitutus sp.]|nr:hypothetical protein [Opitutus sp.]
MPLFRCLLLLAGLGPGFLHAAEDVAVPLGRVHLCCSSCVEQAKGAFSKQPRGEPRGISENGTL